jgi:hypothetical protein
VWEALDFIASTTNKQKKNYHLTGNSAITGVLDQRPNSRGSVCQVQPLTPICQLKRQLVLKGRERRLINMAHNGNRESMHLAHLQGIDMSFWFK